MNDAAVALAIATLIEADPVFEGVAVYAHFERVEAGVASQADEIVLPAILIDSKSEAVAGSSSYARSTLQCIVESQVDSELASVHAARAKQIIEKMTDMDTLGAAFTAQGLTLCGRPASTQSDPEVEHRALRAISTWRIGYGDLA